MLNLDPSLILEENQIHTHTECTEVTTPVIRASEKAPRRWIESSRDEGSFTQNTNQEAIKEKTDISFFAHFIWENKRQHKWQTGRKIFANTFNSKELISINSDSQNQWRKKEQQTRWNNGQQMQTGNQQKKYKWPINRRKNLLPPLVLKGCEFNQDALSQLVWQNCKAYYSIHCWQCRQEAGSGTLRMGVQAGTASPEVTLAVSLLI